MFLLFVLVGFFKDPLRALSGLEAMRQRVRLKERLRREDGRRGESRPSGPVAAVAVPQEKKNCCLCPFYIMRELRLTITVAWHLQTL